VELKQPREIKACTLLPRQDGTLNGGIKTYEIYASTDGQEWGEPIAKGELSSSWGLKRVVFPKPVTAKFLKLVALSGFNTDPFVALRRIRFGAVNRGGVRPAVARRLGLAVRRQNWPARAPSGTVNWPLLIASGSPAGSPLRFTGLALAALMPSGSVTVSGPLSGRLVPTLARWSPGRRDSGRTR
jgi:hypothetical protein